MINELVQKKKELKILIVSLRVLLLNNYSNESLIIFINKNHLSCVNTNIFFFFFTYCVRNNQELNDDVEERSCDCNAFAL